MLLKVSYYIHSALWSSGWISRVFYLNWFLESFGALNGGKKLDEEFSSLAVLVMLLRVLREDS